MKKLNIYNIKRKHEKCKTIKGVGTSVAVLFEFETVISFPRDAIFVQRFAEQTYTRHINAYIFARSGKNRKMLLSVFKYMAGK